MNKSCAFVFKELTIITMTLNVCMPQLPHSFIWVKSNSQYSPRHQLSNLSVCHSQIMDDSAPLAGCSGFAWLVGASQVLGVTSVVLTGVWMGHYRGGFAWDGSSQEFNLHPLCMVLGLVFLQGDGESIRITDQCCHKLQMSADGLVYTRWG